MTLCPPYREDRAVFTFATTHQAMAAEDILREAGFRLEVIPPPAKLSAGCGLALRVSIQDVSRAASLLRSRRAGWDAVHEVDPKQEVFRKLDL